jgi:hypothetical protein
MDTHVKVLGVLQIILSGLGLCAALFLMLVFGGAAGITGASGDPNAAGGAAVVGVVGMFVVGFIVILSLPGVIVGIGLLKFRPWARIGGIVLSVLHLLAIPIGTILGIYGLWVLLSKDTEPLFKPPAPGVPSA